MINTAVILAAGLGSRLKDKTKTIPKGFIPVGGRSLIERSVDNLFDSGIQRILIGIGYHGEIYEKFAQERNGIECIYNEQFQETGSMFTLYCLRDRIKDQFLLLESDLLYDQKGLDVLINHPAPDVILASGRTQSNDEVFIETIDGYLKNMSKKPSEHKTIHGELVGISKISLPTFQKMCLFAEKAFSLQPKLDYEYAMVNVGCSSKIVVHKVEDFTWCEIDDAEHLYRAEHIILPKIKELE